MSDESQLQRSVTESRPGAEYYSARTLMREDHSRTNSTAVSRTVVEMVAAQAAANPPATALVAGSEIVTYAELDRRSNQIAAYLTSLGVAPDQLVGLSMERSPRMVIAALAILKAGGAYVPLDPALPAERLKFMLRDAGVQVLLTEDGSVTGLPAGNWRIVDVLADEIASFSAASFACPATERTLAYVIYTSGSTGQPKGAEITHGSLANLISWHLRAFHVTAHDRASHQAAIGFDAAVWEVWPYLAAGASVHITPDACRSDPKALRDWLVGERISITFLATPLAERMLALAWPSETALRVLLTGADTLHRRPSPTLPFALINNYGPTECTVVATSGVVEPADLSANPANDYSSTHLPSIGRAIDNTQTYIVDENLREVPPGTAGELCIAGAGLARGYRGRADLTAQKFVTNPFRTRLHSHGESSTPDTDRLYRTGDLARFLPNGEIEFLGRIDEQIKIRGFRIEPNEIVRVLDQHAVVSASAVVAHENRDGARAPNDQTQAGVDQVGSEGAAEKSLVAYIALTDGATISSTALREYLGQRLPEYMIPVSFVRLEVLPLTTNGKVDRAGLPAPGPGNLLPEDNFVAPNGPIEQRLSAILANLLHLERIGANDNFFLLGGHSLLGTQLIARVSETFGVELPLLDIFDHPTLADMSGAIERLILAKLEVANADPPLPNQPQPDQLRKVPA